MATVMCPADQTWQGLAVVEGSGESRASWTQPMHLDGGMCSENEHGRHVLAIQAGMLGSSGYRTLRLREVSQE